jgi:hypothetical protein
MNHFICLTSTEGQGAYLYDINTEAVYDFELSQDGKLTSGELKPRWSSFFDFLRWYLS